MWPSAQTITPIASPLAIATPISVGSWTTPAAAAAPAPMKVSVNAPMNSATARRRVSSDMAQTYDPGRTDPPRSLRVDATLRVMRRRVTFSRNLTLSLSRTCRCYCKYCAFATHQAHLYAPEEVLEILDGAARRQVKELLVLTGERPEVNPEVRARLREYGHEDFTAYVVWACERALERGLLPHTNLGVLSREDLARLREVTRLAGADAGVGLRAADGDRPRGLADQASRRGAWRRSARPGELRIPFTSGILVGIGETEEERVASLEALADGARRARPHPGGDPAELRPAPALLRRGAGRDRRRGRARVLAHRASPTEPAREPAAARVGLRR